MGTMQLMKDHSDGPPRREYLNIFDLGVIDQHYPIVGCDVLAIRSIVPDPVYNI